jgi:Plavaka transposase
MGLYHQDIIKYVHVLYGDPEFAPHIIFKPEQHYFDEDRTVCIYSDMHTGKWWWDT